MIEYKVKVHENGYKAWYLNGKRHREDGPAIECADGSKIWYIDGKLVTEDKVMNPDKELTVAEISKLLGYDVKIIKG